MPSRNPADVPWILALNRVRGVGPRAFKRLLEIFGSAEAVFGASSAQLRAANVPNTIISALSLTPDWDGVESDRRWLEGEHNSLLLCDSDGAPERLRAVESCPSLLFVQGSISALSLPQLAIIGSRNPSPAGTELAYAFARDLAFGGLAITSGLALGIDAAGHRGALAAGGKTVAVAGTGLDTVYPARNLELAMDILAAGGAIVSEFPIGTLPLPRNFPRRNRIISALALGTLVVEAALRSGSLITAKYALEQNREVFAIPGSIHNPLARGCHALIKQGAKLVETVADILDELPPATAAASDLTSPSAAREPLSELPADCRIVLEQVGFDPVDTDTLVGRTGLTAREVSSMLLILELKGFIRIQAGGRYVRIGTG